MQLGKAYRKLDPVTAYRIAEVEQQANGTYFLTLETLTGARQSMPISREVAMGGLRPPQAEDYVVVPDHLRGYACYLVERETFERNYQEIPTTEVKP